MSFDAPKEAKASSHYEEEDSPHEESGGEDEVDDEQNLRTTTGKRKSTLQKFSKEVFINSFEIIDFKILGGHISYVIRVRGRTKYLVNIKDLAEIGLISKQNYQMDQKMLEIKR